MNVGIPGTGIGGIFYVLCAIFALLLEAALFFVGRGDRKRFLFALKQGALAIGMVLILIATLVALIEYDRIVARLGDSFATPAHLAVLSKISPVWGSLTILALIVVALTLTGFARRRVISAERL